MNGHYKLNFTNGSAYIGNMKNFNRRGYGKFIREDGMTMIGFWGFPRFEGIIRTPIKSTPKNITPDRLNFGESYATDRSFESNRPQNLSVLVDSDQNPAPEIMIGKFLYDKAGVITMNGHGSIKFSNGNIYKGLIVDNKIQGIGLMKYANGYTYKGQFQANKRHGFGQYNQ